MPQELIAVSISHHRANVDQREAVQLSESEVRSLIGSIPHAELLVLSTCNRTEVYARKEPSYTLDSEALLTKLFDAKNFDGNKRDSIQPYFEELQSENAIRHLFSVISGIDSQILGDQQIFSQVKTAFRVSEEQNAIGSFFQKLSQAAFRVAKRVATETSLKEGAATVSYAAVELARKIYGDFRSQTILFIGAGETVELAAKHFLDRKATHFRIANRNPERAHILANRIRSEYPDAEFSILPLDDIQSSLTNVDIILSATSSQEYILTESLVRFALEDRESSSPLVILDLAVPRDVDPKVSNLSNVFLKDIDDLQSIVDRTAERRREEIPKAEAILEEELSSFVQLLGRLEAGPTIKALRDKFEAIRFEELERNRSKFDERSYALLDEMTRKMMNRLLHAPAVSIKETGNDPDALLIRTETVRELFKLDDSKQD